MIRDRSKVAQETQKELVIQPGRLTTQAVLPQKNRFKLSLRDCVNSVLMIQKKWREGKKRQLLKRIKSIKALIMACAKLMTLFRRV